MKLLRKIVALLANGAEEVRKGLWMKKKTIRRIIAGIFAAVMVITALPHAGVSAYAKTSLPVKNHKFAADWPACDSRFYEFKISGNKFSYEQSHNAPGLFRPEHDYDTITTRSYGTIYDVKKVSKKKYTFRIRNNAKKNKKRTITRNGTRTEYSNVFKNGAKMTLYLPGYSLSRLPDDYGDNQLINTLFNNYTGNELRNMKIKGYALYVVTPVTHNLLFDSKTEDGLS